MGPLEAYGYPSICIRLERNKGKSGSSFHVKYGRCDRKLPKGKALDCQIIKFPLLSDPRNCQY